MGNSFFHHMGWRRYQQLKLLNTDHYKLGLVHIHAEIKFFLAESELLIQRKSGKSCKELMDVSGML
jgi:hypothetical protein